MIKGFLVLFTLNVLYGSILLVVMCSLSTKNIVCTFCLVKKMIVNKQKTLFVMKKVCAT